MKKILSSIFVLTVLASCGAEIEEPYWINYNSDSTLMTLYTDYSVLIDRGSTTKYSQLSEKEIIYYKEATSSEKLEEYRTFSKNNSLTDESVVLIDIRDENYSTLNEYYLDKYSEHDLEKEFVLSLEKTFEEHSK